MLNQKNIFLWILLSLSSFCYGQNYGFDWAVDIGGNNAEGSDVLTDTQGNVYNIGFFQGTHDFDPSSGTVNLTSNGGTDMYLQKLNSDGQLIWALSIGANQADMGASMALGPTGNLYICGKFEGTVDFDPGPGVYNLSTTNGLSAFVLKLDPNGTLIWAKMLDGAATISFDPAIDVDSNGNCAVSGHFSGTSDFDPGTGVYALSPVGYWDGFIAKLDNQGNFLWVNQYGTPNNYNHVGTNGFDSDGNVYLHGTFRDTFDFDPGPGVYNMIATGVRDCFLTKLNTNGGLVWAKQYTGSYNAFENIHSLAVSNSDNLYLAGDFRDTVDFDLGPGTQELISNPNFTGIVQKLDSAGNFIWVKPLISLNDDVLPRGIQVDDTENVYVTGAFRDTADFNPGLDTAWLTAGIWAIDAFILKLDIDGNFIWAGAVGGVPEDLGRAISYGLNDEIYATGYHWGTADMDPGPGIFELPSNGGFLVKINSCTPDTVTEILSTCDSLTWIDGITYYSDNNSAEHVLTNMYGCDSIVKLNLTLNLTSDTTTEVITACDSLTWINGITYYSDNNTAEYILQNVNGCDSVVQLNLTVNSTTAIVTQNENILNCTSSATSYQWIDCSTLNAITGETNQEFTAQYNGDFAVVITENGCTDTSACYHVYTIGVDELDSQALLTTYPNPVYEGHFTILTAEKAIDVKLMDITGRVVENLIVDDNGMVDISSLASGEYILLVKTADNFYSRKIIHLPN